MSDDDLSTQQTQLDSDETDPGVKTDPGPEDGSSTQATQLETFGGQGYVDSSGPHAGALAPGTVLFGAYEIVDILGSGGMGDVYRAKHLSLGGLRAIKVMHPDLHSNREAQERFNQEARALLEVHHPGVVRCHDLLRDEDGRVYLVMELIEGIPLSERIEQSPLSPDEVRALGARVASGLAAAHARGVIHRDLSPDNIVLPNGQPEQAKLIDFGIAKVLASGQETIAEGFKGKLSFASPEQLGFFDGIVDARSDYYALGLVLAAASMGKAIDMGRTFAEAVDARRDLTKIPPGVPESLRGQIEPLLAFDPDDRPESVERLFYWAAEPPQSGGIGWRIPALSAFGAAAVGLLAFAWFFSSDAPAPTQGDRLGGARATTSANAAEVREIETRKPDRPPAVASQPPPIEQVPTPRFRELSKQLSLAGQAGVASMGVDPSPLRDGDPYKVMLTPGCDCYALLFSIEGQGGRIDLLYPNAFDRGRKIDSKETFGVPNSALYTLEAVAGEGTDRLKLLLFREDPHFPPPRIDFWSATPEQTERLTQLEDLLERASAQRADAVEVALQILQ